MISYCNSLKTSQPQQIELNELESQLLKSYKPSKKGYGGKGLSLYEYINLDNKEVKIYFDFDKYITEEEYEDEDYIDNFYENILTHLSYLFDVSEDEFAISCDNRPISEDKYKLSYHFILNRKINSNTLCSLKDKLYQLLKLNDIELDISVYKTTKQKFRTIMSKKHETTGSIEKNSLLKPINYKNDLKRHLLQYVEGVEDFNTSIIDMYLQNNVKEEDKKIINSKCSSSMEDIINQYDIIDTTTKDSVIYHRIRKPFNCPFVNRDHKNNNQYIIQTENTLFFKCQDEECKNKTKVLYKKINKNTIEFDRDVFNSFVLSEDQDSNYNEKREYFEKYYIYIRDQNQMYRIQNIYNKKYDYFEREILPVEKQGLMDLKFQCREEDKNGEMKIKRKKFINQYMEDNKRKEIFNIQFNPDQINMDKYYNLFQGFNYTNILNEEDEITEEDYKELKWYLEYLKVYVCDNDEKTFQYFISHFASIIQNPSFLNHIVMLFYSSKQRTGKSNYTKFLSRVLGMSYCYFGSFRQIFESPHTKAHVGTFINIIEEIDFNKSSKLENELKDYSQRETAIYNPKGKTEIKLNTCVRYFGTSNNSNALKITDEDQRIVVLEFKKLDTKEQVNRLERFYENKKSIYMFGEYLSNYEIPFKKRNDWILNRPMTPSYKQMIFNDSIKSFFLELYNFNDFFIEDEFLSNYYINNMTKNKVKIPIKKLYEHYTMYCSDCNKKPYGYDNFKKNIETRYKNSIIKKKSSVFKYFINLKVLCEDLKINGKFVNNIKEYQNDTNKNDTEIEEEEEENVLQKLIKK